MAIHGEEAAARAILYVARGICSVEFPTSCTERPSKRALIVRNMNRPGGNLWSPMSFDGELWAIIAQEIPTLAAMPFIQDWERDLLPVAVKILRDAVETWGTPTLEDSPENPAGQRTPGWAAAYDPFDP